MTEADPILALHNELLCLVRSPDYVHLLSLDPVDWSTTPRRLVWENGEKSGVQLTLYLHKVSASLSTWHQDGQVTAPMPWSSGMSVDSVREIFAQSSWRKRYAMEVKRWPKKWIVPLTQRRI